MHEEVVEWAASVAAHAAELYAREGVLESWHAEEFDLGTGDDHEDFHRLAEAARDGVLACDVLLPGQTVIVKARLPWTAQWPPADLDGADLGRLFAGAVSVEPAERETPSIAVVDRRMAIDLADLGARYAVQVPPRLTGWLLELIQMCSPEGDLDALLLATPDHGGDQTAT